MCLKRLINRLREKKHNQCNGTQVQLYSLSWRGRRSAALHMNTINTAKVWARPWAGTQLLTHICNKAQATHDGPWLTCLVFHSSVDLERFLRAMRCFSSSLFFSAPAKSIKMDMHAESKKKKPESQQNLKLKSESNIPISPFSSARMSGLRRLSVGGITPSMLFSSSFNCIANVENA